jgi:hypothetical protein
VDEERKRVLLIATAILAARKLSQYDAGKRVPATFCAIAGPSVVQRGYYKEIDRRRP